MRHIHGAADHEGVIARQVYCRRRRSCLRLLPCCRHRLGDALGDLPGGTMLAGVYDKDRHLDHLFMQGLLSSTVTPGGRGAQRRRSHRTRHFRVGRDRTRQQRACRSSKCHNEGVQTGRGVASLPQSGAPRQDVVVPCCPQVDVSDYRPARAESLAGAFRRPPLDPEGAPDPRASRECVSDSSR